MKLFCFDPRKQHNVIAGEYNPDTKIFFKKVTKRHYMILEKGYGISEDILTYLFNVGCLGIHIQSKTGLYISKIEDWLKKPIKDYGSGGQRFLGVK
jgi:hypothetical protein